MKEGSPKPINPKNFGVVSERKVDIDYPNYPPVQEQHIPAVSLEERLDHLVQEEPDKYDEACIERVREFIGYETENPQKNKPYRLFKDINDYTLYHKLHPEWQGRSTEKMQKDTGREAGAGFYASFKRWTRKAAKDKDERNKLVRVLFPERLHDWSSLVTLEDWREEFNRHSEWQERIPQEMQKYKDSDASAFYYSFRIWVRKTATSREERIAYMKALFPNYNVVKAFTRKENTSSISADEANQEFGSLRKQGKTGKETNQQRIVDIQRPLENLSDEERFAIVDRYLEFVKENPDSRISVVEFFLKTYKE